MISVEIQEVSAILTKKRLSYEQSEEYLQTGDSFEDELFKEEQKDDSEAHRECAKALYKLLENNLTKKQKCYIILYYKDKLTVKEIAEKFGVDKSTVSRTINRGRRRIVSNAGRAAMGRLFSKK